MFKRYEALFKTLYVASDALAVALSWLVSYHIYFHFLPVAHPFGTPLQSEHNSLLIVILPVYVVVFYSSGIYEAKRLNNRAKDLFDVLIDSMVALMLTIALFYFFRFGFAYSRATIIIFFVLSNLALLAGRVAVRAFLAHLLGRGYNLRNVLIVGSGELAAVVAQRIEGHREFGLKVLGLLSGSGEKIGKKVRGYEILGEYRDVNKCIEERKADVVILALPSKEDRLLKVILGRLSDEMVDIKIIPDLSQFFTLRTCVESLDELPVITLRDTPLLGWSRVMKRAMDIVFSTLILAALSPLLIVIAVVIKLTSPGPVFYVQERMGLDGRVFPMLKFRSMRIDAEDDTGAVWAKEGDPRRTPLGTFLRKTSIDELPQFLNVLIGNMSIVGPRPERPVFVQEFRKTIPKYMLRHKMKAGITGWAQIHGLRGNTSLKERIKFDLYYIEHWNFWLDIRILIRTIPAVLLGKNAY